MKKLFIFLILGIFLISSVSAADWDNKLTYTEKDLKVTIKNSILGLIPTSEIGTAELKSHSSVDEIRKVGVGNQVVMWYDLNFNELYLNGLGEVEFTNMRTKQEIDRDYSFVYLGEKERDVYGCKYSFSTNGTKVCNSAVVGKETYNAWLPYNSKDIPKGNIRMGLMTFVEVGEKVDGVWTIAGKKINRHAVWYANAINYNGFENGAINRTESDGITFGSVVHGVDSGTLQGSVTTTNPMNGTYSFEVSTTDASRGGLINKTTSDLTNHTISWWTNSNRTGNVGWSDLWEGNDRNGTYMAFALTQLSDCPTGVICSYDGSSWASSTINYTANTWIRQIIMVNSTGTFFFINDQTNLIRSIPAATSVGTLTFQSKYGYFDNIAICSGNDFDCGIGLIGILVTLLSPEDTANFTTNVINFSANVSDVSVVGIQNVTIEVFNSTGLVFNETNTSTLEGVYNFSDTFTDGDYNWTVIAYDDTNDLWDTGTRDFNVNTTPNIQFEDPTPINYYNSTTSYIPINVSLTETYFKNITFSFYNNTLTEFYYEDSTRFINESLADGIYSYNVTVWTTTDQTNSTETRNITIDTTAPNITTNSSITFDYQEINTNLTIYFNITESSPDICLYDYNGTNISISCSDTSVIINTTTFTNRNIIFYANDSSGNDAILNVNWNYRLFLEKEIFDSIIVEGSYSTFSANFLTNGSDITIAILYYNETTNTGTISNHGGNNFTISKIIPIPSVGADTNLSFYWNITQGLLNFALDPKNQTVLNLGIDDCSVFTTLIFNYTIVDEEKQDFLEDPFNTTLELDLNLFSLDKSRFISSFSKSYGDTNPATVCLNINLTNATMFSLDSIVRYEALNHTNEYYNLQSFTLKNSTIPQVITLFSLLGEDATEFQITFKDSNFAVVENALIQINRQYISEGVFKTVEIPKTDANGQTVAHLVEKEVIYNFIVIKDNVILGTFNNVVAFCQDAYIGNCFIYLNAIKAGTVVFDYDEEIGLAFSFSYNESSRLLQFPFSTLDGGVKNVSLLAIKLDQLGNTTACSQSLVTSSGTISCPVSPSIGNATLIVEIFVDGDLRITNYVSTGTPFDLGDIGYFLMFFLVLSLALMMTQSKIAVILGVVLGFISSTLLSFVKGGILAIGSSITWLVIMAIILILKLNSQAQT